MKSIKRNIRRMFCCLLAVVMIMTTNIYDAYAVENSNEVVESFEEDLLENIEESELKDLAEEDEEEPIGDDEDSDSEESDEDEVKDDSELVDSEKVNTDDMLDEESETDESEIIGKKDGIEGKIEEITSDSIEKLEGTNAKVDQILKFARENIGSPAYSGWCQGFVKACYESAGIYASQYPGSANEAKRLWRVSNDMSDIPIGACVYWTDSTGGGYGHVAIYEGNGKVIGTFSKVIDQSNTSYVCRVNIGGQPVECWGYQAGYDLYANANHQPRGALDTIEGGQETIHIAGWAIDDDEPNKSLQIHIHIDGRPG